MFLLVGLFLVLAIHPFLAVTDRVGGKYMVVEAWVPGYALEEAARQFKESQYTAIITSGALRRQAISIDRSRTEADYGLVLLERLGISSNKLFSANSKVEKNRTYGSALAVLDWLDKHDPQAEALDVFTLGPHARRSRLLYQKAIATGRKLGSSPLKIGIMTQNGGGRPAKESGRSWVRPWRICTPGLLSGLSHSQCGRQPSFGVDRGQGFVLQSVP